MSYDRIFRWIGQGQISIVIPFGSSSGMVAKSSCGCCNANVALRERLYQRVARHEIIPVHKQHVIAPAINPATNQPYFFWFVDNTSHSDGTFESPFNTLLDAQDASNPNDIIYVYPGDGTDAGMNQCIVLQDSQQLLGSGVTHPITTTTGVVTIPALSTTSPLISNGYPFPYQLAVVLLNNSNTVSGFTIDGSLSGTVGYSKPLCIGGGPDLFSGDGPDMTNAQIDRNTLIMQGGVGSDAIQFSGNEHLGNIVIENNTFLCNDTVNPYNFAISIQGASNGVVSILGNDIQRTNESVGYNTGINFVPFDGGSNLLCIDILNNTIAVANLPNASGVNIPVDSDQEPFCVNLQGNNVTSPSGVPGYVLINNESSSQFTLASPDGALSGVILSNSGTFQVSGSFNFTNDCGCLPINVEP